MENGTAAMSQSLYFDSLPVSFEGANDLSVQQFFDSIEGTVTIEAQPAISTSSSSPETLTNCSISVPETSLTLDDDDIFQCGRCKIQFTSLSKFIYHKKTECPGKSSPPTYSVEKEVESSVIVSQPLDEVSVCIDQQATQVDSSPNSVNTYGCGIGTSEGDPSSPQGAEFINIAIDSCTQVFTMDGISLRAENEGKGLMNLNVPSSLLQTTSTCNLDIESDVMAPHSYVTEVIDAPILVKPVENKANEFAVNCSSSDITNDDSNNFFNQNISKDQSQHPKVKSKHKCPFCEKEFTKNFDLQQHVRSHTGEKPFQCVVCGRPFAQKSNVKKHMATHKVWPKDPVHSTLPKEPIKKVQNDEVQEEILVDNSYVCPFCQLSVNSYLKLRTHMKTHNDRKVYKCIQRKCDATYTELDPFIEHIHKHVKDAQYKCHHCSKAFASLHLLAFHQLEHSIYPRPKKKFGPNYFRCTKCMNKYASAEALEHHRKTSSHYFPCQQCTRVFCSERLLRRHLQVHGTTQTSSCSTCSKEFKSEYSLKLHLLTHTDERPFSCCLCGTAFNRKDKLKRHMLIHEDKKFKCPFNASLGCLREFRRGDKLRLHVLTHAYNSKKGSSKAKATTQDLHDSVTSDPVAPSSRKIKHFANIIRGGKHTTKKPSSTKEDPLDVEHSTHAEAELHSPEKSPSSQSAIVTRTKSGTRPRSDYTKYADSSIRSPKNKVRRNSSIHSNNEPTSPSSMDNIESSQTISNIDDSSLKQGGTSALPPEPSENILLVTSSDDLSLANGIVEDCSTNVIETSLPNDSLSIIKAKKNISNGIYSVDGNLPSNRSILILKSTDDGERSLTLDKAYELAILPNDITPKSEREESLEFVYMPLSIPDDMLDNKELLTSSVIKSESDIEEEASVTIEMDSSFFSAGDSIVSENLSNNTLVSNCSSKVIESTSTNRKLSNLTPSCVDNLLASDIT